ncbi:hypothetical protein D4N09_13620 [Escherichia coli]|uniref:Uncharacterized protein n=1 Tax=Escherichia coli TaxID=562 RepID=A0A8T9CVU5_ECOLX|nr:hypothetical protein BXO92_02675 [Escherichia coli]EGD7794142.1 hypothetical protein [Escherichia coli]EGD9982309.1 hypothetical protein [Escherichia coli]EGE1113244.1 hypothetical protein [Escherichia coli]EGE1497592.1 hypothetical protein [Escherichia coli]
MTCQSENARCAGAAHTKDIGNKTKKKRRKMRYRMDGMTPEVQTNSTSRIFVAQVARLNRICRIEPIINNEILLLFFSPLNVTFANS